MAMHWPQKNDAILVVFTLLLTGEFKAMHIEYYLAHVEKHQFGIFYRIRLIEVTL